MDNYKATGDEKTRVLRELKDLDSVLERRRNAACEKIRDAAVRKAKSAPAVKRYLAAKKNAEIAERALKAAGYDYGYNGNLQIDSDLTAPLTAKEEASYQAALKALSNIRTDISLANLRSEVKALVEQARKL